jgi:hypothetical protein
VTAASAARDKREETGSHAPEPWAQLGRYVRDATGRIVLRGKTPADVRRVVACINAFAGVPTEAVETFQIQVSGGAGLGPDPALAELPDNAAEAVREFVGSEERRMGERRRRDRRRSGTRIAAAPQPDPLPRGEEEDGDDQ